MIALGLKRNISLETTVEIEIETGNESESEAITMTTPIEPNPYSIVQNTYNLSSVKIFSRFREKLEKVQ
jgi:hypothetical protein